MAPLFICTGIYTGIPPRCQAPVRLFWVWAFCLFIAGAYVAEASPTPFNEKAIVVYKKELSQNTSQDAHAVAAEWIQAKFEPNRFMAVADLAFYQKDVSLARQLISSVSSETLNAAMAEYTGYLFKGIYEAIRGNEQKAESYFDSLTRSPFRLLVSRGYYFQGEMVYQRLKTPEKSTQDLERMHYFFKKAIEYNSDHVPSYFGIARRYIYEQKWDMAINQLKLALQIDGDDVLSLYNLGLILAEKKLWDEAYLYLERALKLHPQDTALMREYIPVAFRSRNEEQAQQILQKLLDDPTTQAPSVMPLVELVLFNQIERDFNAGQIQKALDKYLALENRFPKVPEIHIRIGMCYRAMGTAYNDKAMTYFGNFIRQRPEDYRGFFEAGVLEFERGDPTRAARHFLRALASHPQDGGNIWLWLYKSLDGAKLNEDALFVLSKAEEQPYLELHYRDIIRTHKTGVETKLKLNAAIMRGLTFSVIDTHLQEKMIASAGSSVLDTSSKYTAPKTHQ